MSNKKPINLDPCDMPSDNPFGGGAHDWQEEQFGIRCTYCDRFLLYADLPQVINELCEQFKSAEAAALDNKG